jgi:hypothetical protein
MTPAALDANRANAGKARAASNFQDNHLAQTLMVNCHAQFEPVTPTDAGPPGHRC